MGIYLVQHGKNLPKDVDPDKGLSEEGRKEVERVASAAKKCGLNITAIRHSGKKRAMQTAEIFESILGSREGVREMGGLGPTDDVTNLAAGLDQHDNTMFVGHLPFMEKLVACLIRGTAEVPVIKFRNGGIVFLERDRESGEWIIQWVIPPLEPVNQ
jgi:phosphohistidine phosphatase